MNFQIENYNVSFSIKPYNPLHGHVKQDNIYIFTINGAEFNSYNGLVDCVLKLKSMGVSGKKVDTLFRYSLPFLRYSTFATPSMYNLIMNDGRPFDTQEEYSYGYCPWGGRPSISPVMTTPISLRGIMASEKLLYRIGNYTISSYGTYWITRSLVTGSSTYCNDLSVCIWVIYNWGCIENSVSDVDKMLEFCDKWLTFVNSKVSSLGIRLEVKEDVSEIQLSDVVKRSHDGQEASTLRSPPRDERKEIETKRRGRPRRKS